MRKRNRSWNCREKGTVYVEVDGLTIIFQSIVKYQTKLEGAPSLYVPRGSQHHCDSWENVTECQWAHSYLDAIDHIASDYIGGGACKLAKSMFRVRNCKNLERTANRDGKLKELEAGGREVIPKWWPRGGMVGEIRGGF